MDNQPCADAPSGCQIGDLFQLLSKAHMMDILHTVIHQRGPHRFVDLQKRLALSPNTLSNRLKALLDAGLVTRTAYNEIPPRVDYEATPKALDLTTVFQALHEWSLRHNLEQEITA